MYANPSRRAVAGSSNETEASTDNHERQLLTDGGEDIDDVNSTTDEEAPQVPEDAPPEDEGDDVPVVTPDDDVDGDSAGDEMSLIQDAMQAFSDAKNKIQDLDPYENDEDNLEEVKAVQTFKDELGTLIAAGLDESDAHAQCGQLAKVSTYNKSQLKKKVNAAAQNAKSQSSGRRMFNEVLEDDLIEVLKVSSTDHHQRTIYRWKFEKGTVETRQSKDETNSHFSWGTFRLDYYDATGEMPEAPPKTLRDGAAWVEFVVDIIDKYGRSTTNKGPRTCAVEELDSHIGSSRGYAELEDALQHDGVYIDDDPANGDPDEVWVPNSVIKRICDNNELGSTRALQVELDARGVTSPDVSGVSHTESINGRVVTFWRLRADFATPADYVVNPKTPAQQLAQRNANQDDDRDDGSPKSGLIDSVTDNDVDEDDRGDDDE